MSDVKEAILRARGNPRLMRRTSLESLGIIEYISLLNLPATWKLKEKMDWIILGHLDKCLTCDHEFAKPNSKWCSLTCRNKDPELRASVSIIQTKNAKSRMTKTRKTMQQRYGVEHVLQIPGMSSLVSPKQTATMVERYGTNWGKEWYDKCAFDNGGIHPGALVGCKKSKAEFEIIEWIKSVRPDLEIVHGDRKTLGNGKEIDIWIPALNLGIEHDGVYWHAEGVHPIKYNVYEKKQNAKAAGIRLINLWDYEWHSRKEQCKNFLMPILGCVEHRVYARKCKVIQITKDVGRKFICDNHIQNLSKGSYFYALFDETNNDKMIAVMGFASHHRGLDEIVLQRFCCASGYSVVGGASKLMKHAMKEQGWTKITSWSDNRISEGSVYDKIGFIKDQETKYDYFYLNGSTILAKQACTKKKIGAKSGQTEYERSIELGYKRVWDAGKIKWIYTIDG